MSRQRGQPLMALTWVLLFLTPTIILGDYGVHIMSKYRQRITSTTLNWLPRSHFDSSKEIVIGGFEIIESEGEEEEGYGGNQAEKTETRKPLYVCRVYHTTVWVAGSQRGDEKRCTVTIHGNVQSYDKYELLENVDNAARVNWQPWDKYTQIPVGTVATEHMYVARHAVEHHGNDSITPVSGYTHYIGTLDVDDNLGTISYVRADGTQGTAKSGDVLVETEPIGYNLTRVKLNWPKRRIIKRVPRILDEATIQNTGSGPARMAQAFAYSYEHSVYWGQGHAILKGPNVSITLTNGTSLPMIIWGAAERSNRTDVYTVQIDLEPGTGVNVTLKANYTDMEVPYTGTLISHYEDGQTKSRVISNIRRESAMFDITPEFGAIYFLSNHTLVPTTTPPPTTEPTTTSNPEQDHNQGKIKPKKLDHQPSNHQESIDENMIVPPRKSDMSNMQSDDGGPLSLKNKVENNLHNLSPSLRNTRLTFLAPLLVYALHRVT